MIHERFGERFEEWLGLIRDHHTVHGSTAQGRITAENPREGFVGDADAGHLLPPDGRRRRHARGRALPHGDVRADRRRRALPTFDEAMALANDHGYGLSSSIYTRRATTRSASASASRPGWCRSTTRPRAPRRTCPSAATASRATARASRGSGCSTSSRAGRR